ncbi:MAG: tetratricopeptide repeat protein [Alphaproteobacteria bacterium]
MKKIAFAFLLTFLLSAPARAGLNAGVTAYERGDYTTALKELSPLAEEGDAAAQYYLGALYESGFDAAPDYDKAIGWYRRAAAQRFARAQYHLGQLYEIGEGVERDYTQAAEWYRRAAKGGYAPAQSNLARLYLKGLGVAQDYYQSYLWAMIAMQQGYTPAKKHSKKAAVRLSSGAMTDAQQRARKWLEDRAQ